MPIYLIDIPENINIKLMMFMRINKIKRKDKAMILIMERYLPNFDSMMGDLNELVRRSEEESNRKT